MWYKTSLQIYLRRWVVNVQMQKVIQFLLNKKHINITKISGCELNMQHFGDQNEKKWLKINSLCTWNICFSIKILEDHQWSKIHLIISLSLNSTISCKLPYQCQSYYFCTNMLLFEAGIIFLLMIYYSSGLKPLFWILFFLFRNCISKLL